MVSWEAVSKVLVLFSQGGLPRKGGSHEMVQGKNGCWIRLHLRQVGQKVMISISYRSGTRAFANPGRGLEVRQSRL